MARAPYTAAQSELSVATPLARCAESRKAVAAEAEAVAVAQVRGTRGRALKVVNTVVPLTRGLTTEAAAFPRRRA